MFRRTRLPGLLFLGVLLAGCSFYGQDPLVGYLITYASVPYTRDLDHTPVASGSGDGAVVRLREPFTGYGIYTELDSNAIGDIAREHGLQTVYFADLQTFSLFNIWRRQTLTIYGR